MAAGMAAIIFWRFLFFLLRKNFLPYKSIPNELIPIYIHFHFPALFVVCYPYNHNIHHHITPPVRDRLRNLTLNLKKSQITLFDTVWLS